MAFPPKKIHNFQNWGNIFRILKKKTGIAIQLKQNFLSQGTLQINGKALNTTFKIYI